MRSHKRFIMRVSAFAILTAMPWYTATPSFAQKKARAATGVSANEALRADTGIRKVLSEQTEAWNRGDVDSFVHGYFDSDATLYIGKRIERGYAEIASHYKTAYPTSEKMGRLTFANLEVHQLDQDYAAVVGNFHLQRKVEAGGDAEGVFTLIFEKTAEGWKIVLDHTS